MIAGGESSTGGSTFYSKVELYDVASDAWSYLADLPEALSKMTLVSVGGGAEVYSLGGKKSWSGYVNSVYRYDVAQVFTVTQMC